MNNNPTVSFIIPIFNNTALQLQRCLISLKKINDSKEILVIDDGSSKKNGQEYKKMSMKYGASYFYKNNGGVSSARNFGLRKATGSYVTFIDADDECNVSSFNIPDKISNTYDVYIYSVRVVTNDKTKIYSLGDKDKECNIYDLKTLLLKDGIMNWSVAKLYLKSFLQENNIKFNENIISGEDWNFVKQVIQKDPKIYYINNIFYTYYLNYETSKERVLRKPQQSFDNVVRMFKGRSQILDTLNLSQEEYISYRFYLNKYLIDYVFSTYLILVSSKNSQLQKYNSLALQILSENTNKRYTDKIEKFKVLLISKNSKFFFFLYTRFAKLYKNIRFK